jgi:hypothetical protein
LKTTRLSVEVPFGEVPESAEGWNLALFIAYGPGEHQLGSGVPLGESYGPYEPVIVDRDGMWRVADVYKSRVARFDSNGEYVDSIPTKELQPLAGMVALDNGSLVAAASGNRIAVIDSDSVELHSAEGAGNATLLESFQNSAFGFGSNGVSYEFRVEGDSVVVESDIEFFRGADGGQYDFSAADLQTLRLNLLEERTVIDLVPVPDDGSKTEVVIGEPVRDKQGRMHVILYGTSIESPEVQRGVYIRIDGTELAETAPLPDMFSGWGWSLLTNLTVDNEDNALLTAIDPDGVRVWRYPG